MTSQNYNKYESYLNLWYIFRKSDIKYYIYKIIRILIFIEKK